MFDFRFFIKNAIYWLLFFVAVFQALGVKLRFNLYDYIYCAILIVLIKYDLQFKVQFGHEKNDFYINNYIIVYY